MNTLYFIGYLNFLIKSIRKFQELRKPTWGFNSNNPVHSSISQDEIGSQYSGYCYDLKLRRFVLVNEEKKTVAVTNAFNNSRYSPLGARKKKRAIEKKLDIKPHTVGVFLTLTVDHKKYTIQEAWEKIGQWLREFKDKLNKERKKQGLKPLRDWITIPEHQPESGYPAPHILYVGLKFLLKWKEIEKLWGHGHVKPQGVTAMYGASYILKYLDKFSRDEQWKSLLWFYRIDMFSFSSSYSTKNAERVPSPWMFLYLGYHPDGEKKTIEESVCDLIDEGYTVSGRWMLKKSFMDLHDFGFPSASTISQTVIDTQKLVGEIFN